MATSINEAMLVDLQKAGQSYHCSHCLVLRIFPLDFYIALHLCFLAPFYIDVATSPLPVASPFWPVRSETVETCSVGWSTFPPPLLYTTWFPRRCAHGPPRVHWRHGDQHTYRKATGHPGFISCGRSSNAERWMPRWRTSADDLEWLMELAKRFFSAPSLSLRFTTSLL